MKKKPILISLVAAMLLISTVSVLFALHNSRNAAAVVDETKEAKWNAVTAKYEESKDVWMETQYSVYPEGTRNVIVKWFNKSAREQTGGEFFTLEKRVDGVWRTVEKETDINYCFNDIGYRLRSGESYWQNYDLIPYTDGLNAGEYRISADVITDYPAGIQCYGYFKVGKKPALRNVAHSAGVYEYVDAEYGFVLLLTPDWEGCKPVVIHDTGDPELNELAKTIDPGWFALRIRHPDWLETTSYQDIILACVDSEKWNSGEGLEKAVGEDFTRLPRHISTNTWVMMFAEKTLDRSCEGYDSVVQALDSMSPIR